MTVQEYFKKEWLKRKLLTLFYEQGRYNLGYFKAHGAIKFGVFNETLDVAVEELVFERKITIRRERECFGYVNYVYRI